MCPFSFDLFDEQQSKKPGQDQQQAVAPSFTGGGQSFGGGTVQGSSQPEQKGVQTQGSGFVGLDQYMNANKGSNFGNQFTGKVEDSVGNAKQSLDQGAQDFTNASNQGAKKWNDVQSDVTKTVDNAGSGTSADDAKRIQDYAKAQYQGPTDFGGTTWGQKAQSAVSKAGQESNALQSEGGRFALLDQYFGRPSYNMGEKTLDNALVQNAPGVGAKAQFLDNQSKQLGADAGFKTQDLNNLAAQNRQATMDTAANTSKYLGDARTGFETDLKNRYNTYAQGVGDYNKAFEGDLSDDTLGADTLAASGLKEGDNLYGLNLSDYLQKGGPGTVGQFASDSDYARSLALAQLAGDDNSILSASDRAKAGTANGKDGFDQSRLSKALADQKAAYEAESASTLNPLSEQVNNAKSYLDSDGPNQRQQAMGRYRTAQDQYNAAKAALDNKYNLNRKVKKG
jgi:hypothetical protein